MSHRYALMALLCWGLSTSVLTSCSNDKEEKKSSKLSDSAAQIFTAANKLSVTDAAGAPLAGAQVLIGSDLGHPFANNFLKTDAGGQVEFPAEWTTELAVTIDAPGFIRTTFLRQTPSAQIFKLRKVEPKNKIEFSGKHTGFKVVNQDGQVDFGITLPAIERRDFLSFDISSVISNENDVISIFGKEIKVPSNVSLPTQEESYYFSFTLEKPLYRMKFKQAGPQKVVTLRGQFPLVTVVDEIQNKKDFGSLINYFDIQGGAFKSVTLSSSGTKKDLPIDEMNFSKTLTVNAPSFDDGDTLVLASAMNVKDGSLYPSDVKNLTPKTAQVLKVNSSSPLLLAVQKRRSETQPGTINDRLSATLVPFQSKTTPTLLPLIDDPRIMSSRVIKIPALKPTNGVTPTGTYLTLASVSASPEILAIESLSTTWDVYSPKWEQQVELPAWPHPSISATSGKMRWGVTLLGQNASAPSPGPLGPDLLDSATHATHSSIDF